MNPSDLAQRIYDEAPQIRDQGKTYYVVETDMLLLEAELVAYAEHRLEGPPKQKGGEKFPDRLVAAMWKGSPVRWKAGTRLDWALDRETFPSMEATLRVQGWMESASRDWNQALEAADVNLRFRNAEASAFRVRFADFDSPGLVAVAFFPHDDHDRRVVRVGALLLQEAPRFDPVGVLRHELGHVLGFRHEHIRDEAPEQIEARVIGRLDGLCLGDYDPMSCMHYPMYGAGSFDFRLTDLDREGLARLYDPQFQPVSEFER